MQWVVLVVAVVALFSAYVTWLAARLDRLAGRSETAAAAVEAALARIATGDPAASVSAHQRLEIARQMHADALHDHEVLRNRISVKLFGLGRRHPISAFATIDPSPALRSTDEPKRADERKRTA